MQSSFIVSILSDAGWKRYGKTCHQHPANNPQKPDTCPLSDVGVVCRFQGVCYKTRDGMWYSTISLCRKSIHLGSWWKEEPAACAYDLAAIAYKVRKPYSISSAASDNMMPTLAGTARGVGINNITVSTCGDQLAVLKSLQHSFQVHQQGRPCAG